MTETGQVRRYRFGVFEANAATGELRRQGTRVKINAQPFQLLLILLERPGEVVTREAIAQELWPDGTFVDFEHGVNSAVNRIREALGDTAGNPRFVETLARRGYRFVAPVERVSATDAAAYAAEVKGGSARLKTVPAEAPVEAIFGKGILASPHELPRADHRVVKALFVALQLMYLAFYVGALLNLAEIEDLFAVLPSPALALDVLLVTAVLLIPVRAFLLSAVFFRAPAFRQKYLRLWLFVLPFDILWALAPFLLLHHINYGLALACTALLVYSPFAQRSLMLMGAVADALGNGG